MRTNRRFSALLPTLALVVAACSAGAARAPSSSPAQSERTGPAAASVPPTPAATRAPTKATTAAPTPEARLDRAARATPPPTPAPPPAPQPIAIDLYEKGDFVSQATKNWCVPGAIASMANLVQRGGAATVPSQRELDRLARSLSSDRLVGAGSEPEGWAGTLNRLGVGPYVVVSERTREGAIATAARAMRLTGRPVGLLVWRGAHACVMSGFEATADPLATDDFAVTHVRVVDPWYPRISSIWGPGKPPSTRIPVEQLDEDYLRWKRPTVRYVEKDGQFVLVLPVPDRTQAEALRSAAILYLSGR